MTMSTVLPLVLAAALALGWLVYTYNGFVKLQQRAAGAFADIDAQLKRRHDLVPALVETVKGYAGHEKQTLEEVVRRRSEATAMEGSGEADGGRQRAENFLARALRGVFVLAEAYPELKASDRFAGLQSELSAIESDLQHARRYYNAVVRDYNTSLASFPALLVATPFGFRPRPFFELDSPLERDAIAVDLDGES
jgi:LemA protein